MAYDEELAKRIRGVLAEETGLIEKKMFGGVGFIIDGNMAVGIHRQNNLLVRINPDSHEAAMSRPNVRKFEMKGRSMTGWIVVDSAGLGDDAALASWVQEGAAFARSLPPK